ncbi:MAG TPA: dihydroneopterin aldolase [Gammaproteobacteria bacterium]|nr:dihydroneopterin aldolase [Gammaproteobacteria bacterium]
MKSSYFPENPFEAIGWAGIQYHVCTIYGKRMTKLASTSSLSLNGLCLAVFLGVYPEEKQKKQKVRIDAHIRFPEPPAACHSDLLEDTYCYDKLISHLKKSLSQQKFQLIENFAATLYTLLKAYFPTTVKLAVRVTKQPRIPELKQGVTFEYGDEVSV